MMLVANPHPILSDRRRTTLALLICGWLILVQPGLSFYWLIDPHLHAEIDEALYGQSPDGATLPGHDQHVPHQHPVSQGIPVSAPLYVNPFGREFYRRLFTPAIAPALCNRCTSLAVFATSIVLTPPDQPPRA